MKEKIFNKMKFAPAKSQFRINGVFAYIFALVLLLFCGQMYALSSYGSYIIGGELVLGAALIANVAAWRHFFFSSKSFGDAYWTTVLAIFAACYGLVIAYPLLTSLTIIFWITQIIVLGAIIIFLKNSSLLYLPQEEPVLIKK